MAVGSIGDAESVLFDIVEDEVNESGGTLERLTIDKIKSLRSSLETNEELSAEERKDALNRGSDVWLDIWKAAVLKSNTYDFNKRNNEMNWIVPGRLAVLIDDVVTKDQLKQTEGNKSVFYRKTVQYKDLNVGYGGRVRIYSAEGSPPSNKTEEPGRKSLSVAKPEWLYLVNGSPQLPDLGLVEYIERKIMFYARRTGDGSDKIGASAEEPYSMKKNITYEATEMPYQIKEITENPKLILHRNDRENILKDSLTPGPLFSAQNLLEATLRSGIQHQMPLYDELKKVKGK